MIQRVAVFALAVVITLMVLACGTDDSTQGTTAESASQSRAARASISSSEARAHVGERSTVCGDVESTRYASGSRGRPTFLNLGRAFPNQEFTVVIWGDDRGKFTRPPESAYADKNICATGLIGSFDGTPQIEASSPDQITIR